MTVSDAAGGAVLTTPDYLMKTKERETGEISSEMIMMMTFLTSMLMTQLRGESLTLTSLYVIFVASSQMSVLIYSEIEGGKLSLNAEQSTQLTDTPEARFGYPRSQSS